MKYILSVFLVFAATEVIAQEVPEPATMERLLIPLALDPGVSGAFRSYWVTELWLRNDSDRSVIVFRSDPILCNLAICPIVPTVPARTDVGIPLDRRDIPAAFLYVERTAIEDVSATLHVRDLTRQELSHGTELPIIRERELLTGHATLLAVPTDPRFRLTLRVYDVDKKETDVRVRVLPMRTPPRPFVADARVPFIRRHDLDTERYATHPGFASVDLHNMFPEIVGQGLVRVEVIPDSPDTRFWAFISITNNDTQQVTTITPNP